MLQPWHWFVFGVVLIIAEMFLPSFFLLWFGAAAVVVSGVVFVVPMGASGAILLWLVLSAIFCLAWFKWIQPTFKSRTKAGLGAAVIIGEVGMITKSPSGEHAGVVRFSTPKAGASEWVCRSQGDLPLAVGERVEIVNIVGNELLVKRK